uniref:hypothetical protein n=1 Tax=Candidatus Mycobacterium methanotrophicum TaxID=2943498 RepID=UPI0035131C35
MWLSRSLRNGRPKTRRRAAVESLDTRAKSKPNPDCPVRSRRQRSGLHRMAILPRRTRKCEWL